MRYFAPYNPVQVERVSSAGNTEVEGFTAAVAVPMPVF
ncbi:hypothetical protein MNB_SV-10-56 [hydrothermal vent metagenome]|uniref:Uncharacterized protein n=1 Tax=hydrothermal vent metagenome TaxID=652676 RepID=A0A1W1C2W1_9ZZZZ